MSAWGTVIGAMAAAAGVALIALQIYKAGAHDEQAKTLIEQAKTMQVIELWKASSQGKMAEEQEKVVQMLEKLYGKPKDEK